MGLVSSLLDWFRGLVGPAESDAVPGPEPTFQCAICGTSVADPDSTCPLCGSSDIITPDDGAASSDGLSGRPAAERTVADDTSAAAATLARTDLLARHEDRWERVDGGYRVTLPTGVRKVDSKEEVRAILYDHQPFESE